MTDIYGMSVLQEVIYLSSVISCGLLFLVNAYVLLKKPSWLHLFFLLFLLTSLLDLSGAISVRLRFGTAGYDMSEGFAGFRRFDLIIAALKYVFLLFFVQSTCRYRFSIPVTLFLSAAVVGSAAVSFYVYSLFPELIEISILLYIFLYWLITYINRSRIAVSERRLVLLKSMLICCGFFLTAIILETIEKIPQAGVYVSILLLDFYPIFTVSLGAVYTFWAIGDLRRSGSEHVDTTISGVSAREHEVIELILQGLKNTEIAERLFISESTVKKHINSIFRKLEISSRWELLKKARNSVPKPFGAGAGLPENENSPKVPL